MAGLYVHIPFCKQACHYCDFHFSTNQQVKAELVDALCKELVIQKNYLEEESIETIYFGGGTPSLLDAEHLSRILETIHAQHTVSSGAEITLEANPDDLTLDKLHLLYRLGVNRLSIGFQTFDDSLLKYLNRAHTNAMALNSFYNARQAGFTNISVDLIYGIPDQSNDILAKDVDQIIVLNPEHVSCYSLTIEDKTVFGRWHKAGKLHIVDDEVVGDQMEQIVKKLSQSNYEHYEISNFSKPGFQSKHNSSYWKQRKYLGIGPSAHSFNGTTRQFNINNNHKYLASVNSGVVPFELEVLTIEDRINEILLTTLRTSWGCDLKQLKKNFNYDLIEDQRERVDELMSSDLVMIHNDHLILTHKGKLLADKISSEFFLIKE